MSIVKMQQNQQMFLAIIYKVDNFFEKLDILNFRI